MDNNRKTAYLTLMDVDEKKSYSNIALNHQIAARKPDSPGLVRELVYGVLENKYYLDYIISALSKNPNAKLKSSDANVLRMGLYQMIFLSRIPDYAAINEAVQLARHYCRGRQGFINGVLREYQRKKLELVFPGKDDDFVRYLCVKYSYEPWIIELWLKSYEKEFVEALSEAGNHTPDLVIRTNLLKTTRESLVQRISKKGFSTEPGRLIPEAIHVSGAELLKYHLYADGFFSVQDESSMLAVKILDPKPGELILDVCAAPGGKALYMAEQMQNKGRILARDIYPRKLALLEQDAKRLGITIIETLPWDAQKVDETLLGLLDRVLVDAPCSGLGVIRRKPEIKYKKAGNQCELAQKQLDILSASARYVKKNGILVYSTCTICSNENQGVITAFLRKYGNFEVTETIQLFPNVDDTDGFFICKLVRTI